jgi:hypothetical protein
MESDQLAERQQPLADSKRTKHSPKEMLYRVRDPELVADTLMRAAAESRHLISRSEFSKLYRRFCGHTMCSLARLRGLHEEVKYIAANHLPGDLIECGCARGGSAALTALSLPPLALSPVVVGEGDAKSCIANPIHKAQPRTGGHSVAIVTLDTHP